MQLTFRTLSTALADAALEIQCLASLSQGGANAERAAQGIAWAAAAGREHARRGAAWPSCLCQAEYFSGGMGAESAALDQPN